MEKRNKQNSTNAFIIDQTGAISCMSSICDISQGGSNIHMYVFLCEMSSFN